MIGTQWVAFWWLAFAASHLALSSRPLRAKAVALLGAGPFAGLYSLVAALTFVPLVWTYWDSRHDGPLLWSLRMTPGAVPLALALAGTGMALVAASFAQPSATGMDPRAVKRSRGVTRITRHPLFMGFALWGLAHSIVNGFLADVVFFGGFTVFGVVGAAHQDARKRREDGHALREFYEETSLLPFAAVLSGRNRIELSELPLRGVALGVVAAAVLYLLHPVLFR